MDFWTNVMQGAVGSVISLVGIFIAFNLTRRHEQGMEKSRNRIEEEVKRIDVTARYAAEAVEKALRLRTSSLDRTSSDCQELSDALVLLGARLGHLYPQMIVWCRWKSSELLAMRREFDGRNSDWQRELEMTKGMGAGIVARDFDNLAKALIPPDLEKALQATSWEAGHVSGLLMSWASAGYPTDFSWPREEGAPGETPSVASVGPRW